MAWCEPVDQISPYQRAKTFTADPTPEEGNDAYIQINTELQGSSSSDTAKATSTSTTSNTATAASLRHRGGHSEQQQEPELDEFEQVDRGFFGPPAVSEERLPPRDLDHHRALLLHKQHLGLVLT